jgi:hypothetical protein
MDVDIETKRQQIENELNYEFRCAMSSAYDVATRLGFSHEQFDEFKKEKAKEFSAQTVDAVLDIVGYKQTKQKEEK